MMRKRLSRALLLGLGLATLLSMPASAQDAPDTDGDGVSDEVEGIGDIDGDGIPNAEDAHDHWVSGTVANGAATLVWLIGTGEDGQLDTDDDVVVGKLDGPEFKFENVNSGAYRVVAGDDPAGTDPSNIHRLTVTDSAVENVSVGGGSGAVATASVATTTPTPEPTTVDDPSPTVPENGGTGNATPTETSAIEEPEASAPEALALDDGGGDDPILLGLSTIVALLFGVLLSYGYDTLAETTDLRRRE